MFKFTIKQNPALDGEFPLELFNRINGLTVTEQYNNVLDREITFQVNISTENLEECFVICYGLGLLAQSAKTHKFVMDMEEHWDTLMDDLKEDIAPEE